MRGGEKCLEALCRLYPQADIYTLFFEKSKISGQILDHTIYESRLRRYPKFLSFYRAYLPFFPGAIESFALKDYDLVISTSHCVAKGIRKNLRAKHLCYCFTPMRYAWGFFEEYFGKRSVLTKSALRFFLRVLREWDLRSNEGVDQFVAISEHVKNRIREFYARDAEVVYPPVNTEFFAPDPKVAREDFYLVVTALVPYKKTDLAVGAFNRMKQRKLVVIGDGPEKFMLQKMAGSNIRFLGWQPDEVIRGYYRRARALIFPGEEDFGIVPVEAQSCGLNVIAYGRGGALETVNEKTGLFFDQQSEAALIRAVEVFESSSWDPARARANALGFGQHRFENQMRSSIERILNKK